MNNRILFIGGYPNNIDKNLYVFFRNLVHAVADLGVECYVISPVSVTKYKTSINKIPLSMVEQTENGSNIKVYYPRYISLSSIKIGAFNTMKFGHRNYMSAAYKVAKSLDCSFDAVYGHLFFSGGLSAVYIGKKMNIPSFIAYGESSYLTQVKNKGVPITKSTIESLAGIISVSTKNTEELKSESIFQDIPIFTCPNAIDLSLFKNTDKNKNRAYFEMPEDVFIAGFVGGFSHRKGDKRILEACKNFGDVKLAFAGDGSEPPQGENVIFCKSVEHNEIGRFLSCLDVFVLPTLNEGCCNAILEAMAAGCAIISSDLSFNDDIINSSNSIRVNPRNIDEIRDAIFTLKENKDLRLKISKKAKEDSLNFTIEKRAYKILSFINSFIN